MQKLSKYFVAVLICIVFSSIVYPQNVNRRNTIREKRSVTQQLKTPKVLPAVRKMEKYKNFVKHSIIKKSLPKITAVPPSGGPDLFGYVYNDSRLSGGPVYNWFEIAPPEGGAGTPFNNFRDQHGDPEDDDGFQSLLLPYPFNFYGIDYNRIYVTINGAIYFTNINMDYDNVALPATPFNNAGWGIPSSFIAAFWDDLILNMGDERVYYLIQDDRIIIEYYNVEHYWYSFPVTFEVILYRNGMIKMQYKDVDFGDPDYNNGNEATVGIQGARNIALQYSSDTPDITNGLAILYQLNVNPALANAGFETGNLNGWGQGESVDFAGVVGPDGFNTPYSGNSMLRLGTASNEMEGQPFGNNVIAQPFINSSGQVSFFYNLYSYDYPPFDFFSYELRTLDDGTIITYYTRSTFPENNVGTPQLRNTGWTAVNIDVSNYVNRPLLLIFNCGGTIDQELWTWCYIDASMLNVTSPNGGEFWQSSSAHQITWQTTSTNNVNIELTTNNGNTWQLLASNIPAGNGSHHWMIGPYPYSNQCKVRISDALNPQNSDISDGVFTIMPQSNPFINGITLLSPVGGENWLGGTTQNIVFKKNTFFPSVKLEYTTDGGSTWLQILQSPLSGITFYPWNVPLVNSNRCKVRVSNWTNPGMNATSMNYFTITTPTGSVNYPNPFNPTTTIQFTLLVKDKVSLRVYNSLGQQVAELINAEMAEGMHEIKFDASSLPSGIYYYEISTGGNREIHKMMYLK